MTEVSLPYDQVCEIIAEEAANWAATFEQGSENTSYVFMERERWFSQFGHALWRALEEAHLAKQSNDRPDDDDNDWRDGKYDGRG